MTCHLCVGFCEGSKVQRQSVALFDGNDYELDQALSRSKELPDSRAASELRLFFLVDLGQLLIARKYRYIDRLCDANIFETAPWLQTRLVVDSGALARRAVELERALETFEAMKFESVIRRSGRDGHNTAELLDSGMLLAPLISALGLYHGLVRGLRGCLLSARSISGALHECGRAATRMLHELDFMPQDYLTALTYLLSINDNETIDPWTSKLPFLDSPST